MEWVTWLGIACAWCAFALNVWCDVRAVRRLRQVGALDQLLQQIVLESFAAQHRGTYQAWANTMGKIRVTVAAIPDRPD